MAPSLPSCLPRIFRVVTSCQTDHIFNNREQQLYLTLQFIVAWDSIHKSCIVFQNLLFFSFNLKRSLGCEMCDPFQTNCRRRPLQILYATVGGEKEASDWVKAGFWKATVLLQTYVFQDCFQGVASRPRFLTCGQLALTSEFVPSALSSGPHAKVTKYTKDGLRSV